MELMGNFENTIPRENKKVSFMCHPYYSHHHVHGLPGSQILIKADMITSECKKTDPSATNLQR